MPVMVETFKDALDRARLEHKDDFVDPETGTLIFLMRSGEPSPYSMKVREIRLHDLAEKQKWWRRLFSWIFGVPV